MCKFNDVRTNINYWYEVISREEVTVGVRNLENGKLPTEDEITDKMINHYKLYKYPVLTTFSEKNHDFEINNLSILINIFIVNK